MNIRAEADPESERLGTIRYGDLYIVLGRYFRWLQIQFDSSPNGRGWVFEELVEIIGDPSLIPDLTQNQLPTEDPAILQATQTWQAIQLTPGGIQTATAGARIIQAPSGSDPASSAAASSDSAGPLPTFTYPPNVSPRAPAGAGPGNETAAPANGGPSISVSDGVAPIVPIMIFVGLGVVGLLISSARR